MLWFKLRSMFIILVSLAIKFSRFEFSKTSTLVKLLPLTFKYSKSELCDTFRLDNSLKPQANSFRFGF